MRRSSPSTRQRVTSQLDEAEQSEHADDAELDVRVAEIPAAAQRDRHEDDEDARSPRARHGRPATSDGDGCQPSRSLTSPAACASPSSASRSRTRDASSRRETRDTRVARCRRGVHAHRGEAERALERPGGHVDELHPPVRDHGQAEEEDAAPDDQVVLALGVAPRAHPSRDDVLRRRRRRRARRRQRAPRFACSGSREARRGQPRAAARGPPLRAGAMSSRRGEGVRHAVSGSSIAFGVLPQ